MTDYDLITLQETLAFQQAELDRLSEEFYAQQKEILQLKEHITYLIEKIQNHGDDSEASAALMENRPPPHY